MTGKDRLALAMRHEYPDRVPVMCQLALGHYFLNAGIAPEKIWFTSDGFAGALMTMQRRYRFDGILVNLWGMPDRIMDNVVSTETQGEDTILRWNNGEYTVFPPDDNAQHYAADGAALKRADLETLADDKLTRMNSVAGYFWNIYHMPLLRGVNDTLNPGDVPDFFFSTIDLVKEGVGADTAVHGEVYSPFTHYLELLGHEQALMSLLTEPERAHAVLEYLTEVVVTHAVALAERGVDAVLISSAFAGGPFLSREMYREYVLPSERAITSAVKERQTVVYTHTCGHIGDRLDLMMATGTMGIDTLDPPPLGDTDLAEALKEIDGRVFVKGNMNAVDLLNFRTREEVVEHATNRIVIGKPGGGYILSTACSVAPRTEPWKLELLTPLSEEIGRY
jgi:hypothetical protein